MDIDTIAPGLDCIEGIEEAISRCDILLVLIGKRWLSMTDASGQRRLDNPQDFVFLEVKAGLERNIRVIPVLVGGAIMPSAQELPTALSNLARRHTFEISDTRWRTDTDRLIETTENILASQQTTSSRIVQELSVSGTQQSAHPEEDIVLCYIPRSIGAVLEDRKRERSAETFTLVQNDHSMRAYTRQEVDQLTPTQRAKLFTADSEMAAWWRGKSPISGAWPLFRVRGGTWLSKEQIEQTPQEHHSALWEIPDLLEWYMQDLEF